MNVSPQFNSSTRDGAREVKKGLEAAVRCIDHERQLWAEHVDPIVALARGREPDIRCTLYQDLLSGHSGRSLDISLSPLTGAVIVSAHGL